MENASNLSYVCNPLTEPFAYETISDCLKRYASATPEKEAIVFYNSDLTRQSVTFSQLYRNACVCAKGLMALGIQKGDVVGLGLPNTLEWIYCHFGLVFAGAVTLGFPYFSKNGDNIVHALRQSKKCKAIIFGMDNEKLEIIKHFVKGTNKKGEVVKSEISGLKFAVRVGQDVISDFPFTFDSLMKLGEENSQIEMPVLSPDDVFMIVLSSGTTGRCKLIPKTHFHISSIRTMTNHVVRLHSEDVIFNASPFIWVGGYVTSFLNFGLKRVTVSDLLRFRTPRQFAELAVHIIEKEQCTCAGMYGPALLEFIGDNRLQCSKFPLKCVFTGGFPLSKIYAKVVGHVTNCLVNAYGSTELGSICYTDLTRADDFRDYVAGYPVRGIELKVVDKNGTICPRNVMGEIYIRSAVRFLGYVNDQESTAKVLENSGWFKTNDAGYLGNDGQVTVTGRLSDVIIVGGAKVSPVNIENVILAHSDVKAVVVVSVEDSTMFQEACACIIRETGSSVYWDDIKNFIEKRSIAKQDSIYFRVLVPKYHIFLDSFPITASGKVAKLQLKESVLKSLKVNQESQQET